MRGRIFPTVNGSSVRSVSSYVQINIYDTTVEELHTRGVDIKQILQHSGCRSIIMDVPIISTELRKVTKNGRCRPRKFGSDSPILGAKRLHSESSFVENDAISENHGEILCRSVIQTQSEEEFMDCRENLHTTSTNADNRGPLTSTPVLSKHNDNDFFNIDISTVVPDASFKYELPVKPLESVYANTDNCYNPLLVKEEPYADGIVNQFTRKPTRSSETEQHGIENDYELSMSLDRTLHGNGFDVEDTQVQCNANEATDKGGLYNNIAENSSKLDNITSQREPQLKRKSPVTPHKIILDLDTHEAVTGHETVADEKVTSSPRSPCSNHAPPANAGRNSGRKNKNSKECLKTQNTTKHNATVTDKLDEEERTIECQIPMCHKTLVYRRKYGKSRLVEHVRTHWERPVKKCKMCDFKASSARKINYHHKLSHPNEPFTGSVSLESKEDLDELLVLWQRCFPGHKYEFPKQQLTISINGQGNEPEAAFRW